jgi:hypothetical protein
VTIRHAAVAFREIPRKRRFVPGCGLGRSRHKGYVGMHRWVGLGVIADNLVNIGRAMQKQADQ